MNPAVATSLRLRTLQSLSRSAVCSICQTGILARSRRISGPSRRYAPEATASEKSPAYEERVHQSMRNEKKPYIVRSKKLKRELVKLEDPVKLAEHTRELLKKGEREHALELVREGSKDRQITVSWNHIINDLMHAGMVSTAFTRFTEMRNRGQKPDTYTYTILFRGLAFHVDKTPSAVERALVLFSSLQAPTSTVMLLSSHVNAAIDVCAKARNLDAIYGITSKLPYSGPACPDTATYTIILECLRAIAEDGMKGEQIYTSDDLERLRAEHILQGKRLWADVLARWKEGVLKMDELLMDAMGRLLLLGNARNVDEILSLVSQTTNIPREIPAIGDPKRPTHLKWDPAMIAEAGAEEESLTTGLPWSLPEEKVPEITEETGKGLFERTSASMRLHLLATPGNRTLSLVMKACGRMNALAAAQRYWDLLSSKITPDRNNFHEYLRVLRLRRNSRLAVELVRQICTREEEDGFGLEPNRSTFRIAMSACTRDGDNPNCLAHVRELLSYQSRYLDRPDPMTGLYLVMMLLRRSGQWPLEEIAPTLDSLDELWVNIKNFTAYGTGQGGAVAGSGARALWTEVKPKVRDQMRELTGKYYQLIENSMVAYREQLDEDTFRIWNKRLSRNRNKHHRDKMLLRMREFSRMKREMEAKQAVGLAWLSDGPSGEDSETVPESWEDLPVEDDAHSTAGAR